MYRSWGFKRGMSTLFLETYLTYGSDWEMMSILGTCFAWRNLRNRIALGRISSSSASSVKGTEYLSGKMYGLHANRGWTRWCGVSVPCRASFDFKKSFKGQAGRRTILSKCCWVHHHITAWSISTEQALQIPEIWKKASRWISRLLKD